MGTKNNPGDFDCYTNAEADEPITNQTRVGCTRFTKEAAEEIVAETRERNPNWRVWIEERPEEKRD